MNWMLLALLIIGPLLYAAAVVRRSWHGYQDRKIRGWRRRQNWRDYKSSRR